VAPSDELGQLLAIQVDSGDIWSTADSMYFLHHDFGGAGAQAAKWSAYIATPNSHVDPWAKACLMARSSLAADASYFAVCRPADGNRIRVQLRPTDGSDTQSYDVAIHAPNTIDDPEAAFVQLAIDGSTVRGLASQDGQSWVQIHEHSFAQGLPLQGAAASSHQDGSVRFLIGNLARTASGAAPTTYLKADLVAAAVGEQASGTAHDGF
jgi:hypothetical protein